MTVSQHNVFIFRCVENIEFCACAVIHHLGRTIRINNLAGIPRIVLPIAKPPLELLRLCYIFNSLIDILADISYNDIRVLDIIEDGGQLEPEIFYKV